METTRVNSSPLSPQGAATWWANLGLKAKATFLAIAIGTVPVVGIGGVAYSVSSQALTNQISNAEKTRAEGMADKVNRFMVERYGDIQVLAEQPVFSNPKLISAISPSEKNAVLDTYIKKYSVYDSIAVFDVNGDVLAQSAGPALKNHKDRSYFQEALKTGKAIISQPDVSKTTGKVSIYLAAPVRNKATGQIIGVVRSRMLLAALEEVIKNFSDNGEQYHLVDASGQFFLALEKEQVGRSAKDDFKALAQRLESRKTGVEYGIDGMSKSDQLIAYAPLQKLNQMPDLKWDAILAVDKDIAFKSSRDLALFLTLGTLGTAAAVAAIASTLASRATQPILASADAVGKIGQGQLDTRVEVAGTDELAILGGNINLMAGQIQAFLTQQEQSARKTQLLAEVAQATDTQALVAPLNPLLEEVRKTLNADRAVIYRFYSDWSGHIAGEAVLPNLPLALADKIEDPCIPAVLRDAYKQGRTVPTSDVFNAGFHPDHLDLMKRLQIKANLVVPIVQGEELLGLLVVHHCTRTHDWHQAEIDTMQEFAAEFATALGGLALIERKQFEAEQAQKRNEALQMELLTLLQDVEGASEGDLTVRADVSAGEIGIVADFFNSIVESLRGIVSQVKVASAQVNNSVGSNELVMGQLAQDAQTQAQQITDTLRSVEDMALSIQQVAENARQAAKVSGIASLTAENGGKTMDRTVDSILQLRETVAETAKKVKRLGESSQQISKVVSLINQIALQTNLLAINASIEAARAGEEGRGFAVVAEEVGALAAQSAAATKEIEGIVDAIQRETSEVVDAMENGTTQVVEGTRQVEEAKESLNQIVKVSREIDELLRSISSATVSQTETSQVVKLLMEQITEGSERTSDTSRQVSTSLQETVAIAQQLQASVGTFKVDA
ncbi:methyl-accepting chemotaxis protein [Altericista sp. CCNU0014]|uniref:methyl-accepting chemotaxis protein n=1 Tax=Altericista sp. CCNU0014 TaxID=3082949 RepID=UPI00384FBAF9